MQELTIVCGLLRVNVTGQGRLLMYVENKHNRYVPYFTSFLTVQLMTGPAFWHIQRLFRV